MKIPTEILFNLQRRGVFRYSTIIVFIVIVMLLAGCGTSVTNKDSGSEVTSQLQEKISSELGVNVSVIDFKPFGLASSSLLYDVDNNIREANWKYTIFDGKKEPSLNEEELKEWEKEENSKYLYGPYEGFSLIRATVMYKDENQYNFEEEVFKEDQINGYQVFYYETDIPRDQITIFVPFEKVVYGVLFELSSDELTKERAFTYMERLIKQHTVSQS